MRWVLFAPLVLAGCLLRVPVQKQAAPLPVAVGVWLESQAATPDEVTRELSAQLEERNLPVSYLKVDANTPRAARHAELLKAFTKHALHASVELRASYFSHLNGRYRWTVHGQVSVSHHGAPPVVERFELPALLDFEREGEAQAIGQQAREIAKRVGTVIDAVLSAPSPTPASAAPSETQRDDDFIYFAMVDRFANGDGRNDVDANPSDPNAFVGGDLAGVEQKLDWLASMGVRTVWLSPIFAMRTAPYHGYAAFHGYWTYDWTRIEPRFGDTAALKSLTEAAHRRGMRVLLDFVINHVGPDSPWVSEKPAWFHRQGGVTDWNDEKQLVNHDVHGLPDLAQENPEVDAYLMAAAKQWAPLVDGFRLDAVKHVPLWYWARFNAELAKTYGPRFELLGELLDGNPGTLAKAQAEGRFTRLFDFAMHGALDDVFCQQAPPLKLAAVLANDRLYANPFALVTLLDNHDLPRIATRCRKDVAKVTEAVAALFFMRGSPSMSWGTEVMLEGETAPANRAPMRFVEHPVKKTIAQLAKLRAATPALLKGSTRVLDVSDDRLALLRWSGASVAVLLVNRSTKPYAVPALAKLGVKAWKNADGTEPSEEPVAPPASTVLFTAETAQPNTMSTDAAQTVRFEWKSKAPSDSLKVVGSAPELGLWNVARAPSLAKGFTEVSLPSHAVVEYKLVRAEPGRAVQWQSGANRWFQVGEAPRSISVAWE